MAEDGRLDPWTGLALSVAFCMGVSAVCSLCEAVLYSVPRSVVQSGAEAGNVHWRQMAELQANPGRPIAGILITNTIANTAGAALAGSFAQQLWQDWRLSLFTAALTLGILWFSEIVPKSIGVVFSRRLGALVTGPIRLLVAFWTPMIWLTELSTRAIQKRGSDAQLSEWELAALLRQGVRDGTLRRREARIVEGVLRLDTLRVREIMTPRTQVVSLPAELPLSDAARDEGLLRHGRIPVYQGEPDRVIGIARRRDVMGLEPDDQRTLGDIAAPDVLLVPELLRVDQLLEKFVTERRHLALVADEYGQIEGLVTLEDVLEQLLGHELIDESEAPPASPPERAAARREE